MEDPDALAAKARATIDTMRGAGATIGYVRVAFADEDRSRRCPTARRWPE